MSLGCPSTFNIRMKEKFMRQQSDMDLPAKKTRAPWVSMQCGHGDIVIMHGRYLQKAFEVCLAYSSYIGREADLFAA
jgi:hypothetical protein